MTACFPIKLTSRQVTSALISDARVQEDQLVMAKVQSASGQGVWCWLANGAVATAALTELHDAFVPNALEGLQAGTFVRAAVAQLPGKGGKLKLTLRSSQGALHAGVQIPQLDCFQHVLCQASSGLTWSTYLCLQTMFCCHGTSIVCFRFAVLQQSCVVFRAHCSNRWS